MSPNPADTSSDAVPVAREELLETVASTICCHTRMSPAVQWEVDLLMGAIDRHVAHVLNERDQEIGRLRARVADWKAAAGAGMRLTDELRAERDSLAAGVPLVCSDERHKTKVFALQATVERVEAIADDLDARGARTMDSSMCAVAGLIRRAIAGEAA